MPPIPLVVYIDQNATPYLLDNAVIASIFLSSSQLEGRNRLERRVLFYYLRMPYDAPTTQIVSSLSNFTFIAHKLVLHRAKFIIRTIHNNT